MSDANIIGEFYDRLIDGHLVYLDSTNIIIDEMLENGMSINEVGRIYMKAQEHSIKLHANPTIRKAREINCK
jgi:hypothetical protein